MSYKIDLQEIAKRLDFDLEDVEMLFEVFLETVHENLQLLKTAIKDNDMENIFKSAHSIKGSSANLTLYTISNIAKEIEQSARNMQRIDYENRYEMLCRLVEEI